jgi:hypothetical protein
MKEGSIVGLANHTILIAKDGTERAIDDSGAPIRDANGKVIGARVTDIGIGIPADQLPRVFEIFSQVESAQERSQGGLGIGLTLVRRLTEMHGGSVQAHSDGPGKGSEFLVRLPIVATQMHPAAFTPSDAPAANGGPANSHCGRQSRLGGVAVMPFAHEWQYDSGGP